MPDLNLEVISQTPPKKNILDKTLADRRQELFSEILRPETENVDKGYDKHFSYNAALAKPNGEEQSVIIRRYQQQYLTPNNSASSLSLSGLEPPSVVNKSSDQKAILINSFQETENTYYALIAEGYGSFLASIETGDVRTAAILFRKFPDLAYNPANCQLLEKTLMSQLTQNIADATYLSDKQSELGFICQEMTVTQHLSKLESAPVEPGKLSLLDRNYMESSDDPMPEASAASLDRICYVGKVIEAYNTQKSVNDRGQEEFSAKDSYDRFAQEILRQLPGSFNLHNLTEEEKKKYNAIIEQTKEILNKKPDFLRFKDNEQFAFGISTFMSSDIYQSLPEEIKQDIKTTLLGRGLCLAEKVTDERGTQRLGEILKPLVDPKNGLSDDPADGLTETFILKTIINRVGQKDAKNGQILKDSLFPAPEQPENPVITEEVFHPQTLESSTMTVDAIPEKTPEEKKAERDGIKAAFDEIIQAEQDLNLDNLSVGAKFYNDLIQKGVDETFKTLEREIIGIFNRREVFKNKDIKDLADKYGELETKLRTNPPQDNAEYTTDLVELRVLYRAWNQADSERRGK